MADLEDVQTVDLMSELLRRLKCAQKPDKRLIFIGTSSIDPHLLVYRCNFVRSVFFVVSGKFYCTGGESLKLYRRVTFRSERLFQ